MSTSSRPAHHLFDGGGEMGALIRAHDWSKTAVGPLDGWSPALRMQVSFLLANRFPMLLWWGPTFCSIYNDAYAPILGAKHPWALGKPVSECWSEIWDVLRPLIETPFQGGPPTWIEDFELEIRRHGYLEEGHFTVAYSPVPDETAPRGIGGVVATVHEISGTVIGERRVAALRDLGSHASEGKTAEQACMMAGATLGAYGKDLPFVLLYLIDPTGESAQLAGTTGVAMGDEISPVRISLREPEASVWPFALASRSENAIVVQSITERFSTVPPGPWSDPPHTAVVMAIPSNKAGEPAGLLVAGISPRLKLDEHYRDFLALLKTQLATAIANARAYEIEKKRAEALAEIDRAKTAFFSNVSHEFRTPLTLMLGPVEELLSRSHSELSPAAKAQLDIVHRNGQRLLRLVNTLLDFSRIEAGRVRAVYQRTDLAGFTSELASVFRSAIERAGMTLTVDCPPMTEPVFVDRDMWEKVVLNLLSNAFKFTFEGEISVSLSASETSVELCVRDTGTGVPAAEMPRLFERFHRIENARGRTHEGSGIGLALVQELVKLHTGSITAESVVGKGTTFTITLPLGSAHLPEDQISEDRARASTSTGATPYVDEALRWLPDGSQPNDESRFSEPPYPDAIAVPAPRSGHDARDDRPRVLVVDDNADMRKYVVRLLAEQYRVVAAADGEAALKEALRELPDLVLTDVMMPRLDGFGLLRELRANKATHDIPVIMLSARAGEESRVEGMRAGSDDYLIKPFGARELRARVGAHLQMARMRREAASSLRESEERFRHMADHAPVMVWVTEKDGACSFLSKSWFDFTGQTPETGLGFGWLDAVHPDDQTRTRALFLAATERNEGVRLEYRLRRHDGESRWVIDAALPRFGAEGAMLGYIGSVIDITEHKQLEERLREQERLKDEFLATLSHELRNPLSAVLGWTQFLKKDAQSPDKVLKAADVIYRSACVQMRLISDLLDLSRIGAGKLALDVRPVELADIIDAAIQSMQPTAEERGVRLTSVIDPFAGRLLGDSARLEQVAWNLLSNAVKFTPAGGEVRIALATSGKHAEIRVTDTGQGISPAFLPHVFERFRQADASTSRHQGGLGIGLALVRQLVELHGGRVRAESEGAGLGASFVVELPRSIGEAPTRHAPSSTSEPTTDLNGIRALVVDDERDALAMVQRILEENRASVDVAVSTDQALEALERGSFDLVISDIGMPGRDGYELAREMRARGMVMPAVALTAFARSEDRTTALRCGYQAHLTKPISAAELVATVASLSTKAKQDPGRKHDRNPPD